MFKDTPTSTNKKLRIPILIPAKVDFTENKITRDERQILHNEQMINPQGKTQ